MDSHTTLSYKRREVDVGVSRLHQGSYIAVLVHDPRHGTTDQLVEYITDAQEPDAAVGAGIEIACALIEGQVH